MERPVINNAELNESPGKYTRFESFSQEESKLIEAFYRFKDKTTEEARKIGGRIKRLAMAGILGAALAAGNEAERKTNFTDVPGVTATNVSKYFSKQTRTDLKETGFVVCAEGLVRKFEGFAKSVNFNFKEVSEEAGNIDNIVIGHTHPLVAYESVGYFPGEIKSMQNGDAAPMPPSLTDFQMIIKANRYYRENINGKKAEGSVVDATGDWKYSADMDHPAIIAYIRGLDAIDRGENAIRAINPKAAEYARQLQKDGTHPVDVLNIMIAEETYKSFAEAINSVPNYVNEGDQEFADSLESFNELGNISVLVAMSNKEEDDQMQQPGNEERLIDEYIAKAKAIGITVKYTPHLD